MELRSNQTTACAHKRNKWKRVKSPPETLEKEQGDAKGKKNVAAKRRARGTGQKGVYGQLGRLTRSYKDTLKIPSMFSLTLD